VCNAGTNNGTNNPDADTPGVLDICIEYFGVD
jgi:hypothetical protein